MPIQIPDLPSGCQHEIERMNETWQPDFCARRRLLSQISSMTNEKGLEREKGERERRRLGGVV